MKGFLIFLAVAFPIVLMSPSFWSLVRMEWGAERIGYVYGKGPTRVTQWATLGPRRHGRNGRSFPRARS